MGGEVVAQAAHDRLPARHPVAVVGDVNGVLGKKGTGKKCKGMEGVIADGKEILEEDMAPEVLDAAIISAAQHVEHYEMAGYGTVRTYAELLGDRQAAKLLQQTLDEEKEADAKLTQLAESTINVEAEAPVAR